jgi:hypothetical protein
LSARRDPVLSLSELTADYYRLRAEAERALALNAGDPAEKEQRLTTAAELEELGLAVLPSDSDHASLEPDDPSNPNELILSRARAA